MDEQQQLKQAETEIEKRKKVLEEIAFQHSFLMRGPLSHILGLASVLEKMDANTNIKNIYTMLIESSTRVVLSLGRCR